MNVKLNVKLLVVAVAFVAAVSVGLYFVHNYQRPRNAQALLDRANREEEEGKLDRAARFLGNYLRFEPHDIDTRVRHAKLLDRPGTSVRQKRLVMEAYEKVLLQDPQRDEIRRRLTVLALETGQVDDALAHLKILQESFPQDPDVLYQMGNAQEIKAQYAPAATLYEAAIKASPKHIESYQRRAFLLRRRLDNSRAADELIQEMVRVNPEAVTARLTHYSYLREYGKPDAAGEAIAVALRLAPTDADVRMAAADFTQFMGNPAEACAHLESGLEKNPRVLRLYQALAGLEARQGRQKEATAVVRRGLTALPNSPELLLYLADLLINAGELAEARTRVEELRKLELTPFRLTHLEARIKVREGKFREAAALVEHIRPQAAESGFTIQLDLLLGQCYEALNETEKQLAVYRRAAALDQFNVTARQGLATALVNMGRHQEALAEYQKLAATGRAPATNWITFAQLLIEQALRQPEAQRQWPAIEQALDEAAKALPNALIVPILRAEVLVAQNKFAEAHKFLTDTRARNPKEPRAWLALFLLLEREGKTEESLALLGEAAKHLGDSVDLRLGHLQWAILRGGDRGVQTVHKQAAGREAFPPAERIRLTAYLGRAYTSLDQPAEARRMWQEVAELQPASSVPHVQLFDLALNAQDEAGMTAALAAIEKIEGPKSTTWHWGEVCRRVRLAQKGDKSQLPEIKRSLDLVAAQRPNWSRVVLYHGHVAMLEDDRQAALDFYLRAIELGERQPTLIRGVAQLLAERQRFTEADAMLRRLQDQIALTGDLQKTSAELALRNVDHARALDLARKAVPADSKDHRDHIWLGHVLWAAGQKEEAETALLKALALNPQAPEAWVALVLHQVRTERRAEAEATLEKAQKECAKPASLAWAQCYEALGKPEQAEKLYTAALEKNPNEVFILRVLADFFMRTGKHKEAFGLMRRFLDPQLKATAVDQAWARRGLALIASSGNDYRQFREALALLDLNFKQDGGTPDDYRARAVVLASRPYGRRQAITQLEELYKRQAPSPEQQFFLAELYLAEKNWSAARPWLFAALSAQGENPVYLVHYVRGLIEEGALADAEQWLVRLEKVRANIVDTVGLRARLLTAHGKAAEAADLVRRFVADDKASPPDALARVQLAAAMLEDLARIYVEQNRVLEPVAEEFYRKLAANTDQPVRLLPLIKYLARKRRAAEALGYCETAWKTCPPEFAAEVSLAVLHGGQPVSDHIDRVERWLLAALEKNPKSLPLLRCLADLRDSIQGRYPEAEALYAQILALEPSNVIALNNLAYLLALKGVQPARALECIERALTFAGPAAELLDTRGVVYLRQGQSNQAIKDLEEAAGSAPTGSTYFHLAQAHWLNRNRPAATEAWKKARSSGLEVASLHPIEREVFRKMQDELETK